MIRPVVAVVAALFLIGPVLAAEAGTRALIRAGRLPEAPSSDIETDVSLANLVRAGRPDILVLGTSGIRSALRPSVLEALIRRDADRAVIVRTAAQPALSLEAHRILVRGLARHDLIPGLVILGLTPSTMVGYGTAGDWFPRSELGRYWRGCAGVAGGEAAACMLGQLSALWRWRGHAGQVRRALAGDASRSVGDVERRLTPSGWLSERPVRRYSLEQRVPRLLEVLAEGVPLPSQNVASFVALIAELRGHGATVVPVALPYAPQLESALEARHPGWRAERDAGYTALATAAGVEIVVVDTYGDWWEPRSQNDLRHLSRRGAEHMTRQLWHVPSFRRPVLEALGSAA